MITTSTGAKKLESSDNWREIFPNPGTSAAGAHNASVDAQDRIQAEVAPIINGKRCSLGAASGDYVLLRNSTIAGKTDGAYVAAKAIPANTDLDSTYLGSAITGGLVNELNNKFTQFFTVACTTPTTAGGNLDFNLPSGLTRANSIVAGAKLELNSLYSYDIGSFRKMGGSVLLTNSNKILITTDNDSYADMLGKPIDILIAKVS